MERLAKSLGIENLSRSQVSNMAKEMDEQVDAFRNRSLEGNRYPVLWVDALYEKVRYDGRVVSMAIMLVCGVNEIGTREILAIEPMLEESRASYAQLFERLKGRGLTVPSLVISDAHAGLVAAIRESFPGACWQRCKVHFMRNILVHVPHRTSRFLQGSSNRYGLLRTWRPPTEGLPRLLKNMRNGSRRPFEYWKTAWKTPSRSFVSRLWIFAKLPVPICWKDSIKKFGGAPE
jgi:hypothetical protein